VNGLLVTEMEEGKDVQLTIDRELQYVMHRELKRTVLEQEAAGAVGIILDAQTSEVMAMDAVGLPIGGEKLPKENWRNRPMIEAFEPGSTLKTFVIAAGMKLKNWQPNTKFNCEKGQLKIGERTVNEADSHHRFGWLTISEILAVSSNIGMTKMAFQLGEKQVKQVLSMFGFGQKTGLDLPGEAKGIIQNGKWNHHLLSNVAFGQGISVTPIQLANAYASIANGGILRMPRITKPQYPIANQWLSPWFERTPEKNEASGVRVLTEAEAQTLRLLLAGVTAPGGTGVSAVVAGYPVAGKTGTAQKVNPNGRGYLPETYISSFIGMIPANEPRFVIYVAVDSPQKQFYGSQVAGPLFSRLATFAVRHEGIAPRWLNEEQAQGLLPTFELKNSLAGNDKDSAPAEKLNSDQMPNLQELTVREVQDRLQKRDLSVRIYGSGRVDHFEPSEGTVLKKNDRVEVWLAE
jgi:cell division protein FtsI (penicillin-binding protein 3)